MEQVSNPAWSASVAGLIVVAGSCMSVMGQTTATWQSSTSGSWFDATRWSTNPNVPNFDGVTSYRAVIDAAGAAYSISLLQNLRLASLRLDSTAATVNHTAGIFDLDGTADLVRGTWRLDGGTIRGGTLAFSTTPSALKFSSNAANTLDGVTISGAANFGDLAGAVAFRNGVNFAPASSLTLSGNSFAGRFLGNQSIAGGSISLGGVAFNASLAIADASTVSIASDAAVNGAGTFRGVAGSALNNAGTISANVNLKTLTLSVPAVQSSGTLLATGGGTLSVSGALTNVGFLRADGGTVVIAGTLSGPGQAIATNAGVIQLNGNTTSQAVAAMQTSSGGLIRLAGTMNNTGAVYSVPSGPDLELANATITGGELAFGAGATMRGSGATLNGVSVTGNSSWARSPVNGLPFTLLVKGGSTLGTITRFSGKGEIATDDAATTIAGNLQFDADGACRVGSTVPASLTLATGSSVQIGAAQDFEVQSGGNIPDADSTLINRGTVTGGGVGSNVWFRPGMFVNEGTINLADGTDLRIGSGPSASEDPLNWSNTGTIRARNGIVRVSGGFNGSSLNGFDIAGSTATLFQATINNTGQSMTFGGAGPAWNVTDVAINGGTVILVGANAVQFTGGTASEDALELNGVTLNGDLNLKRSVLSGTSGSYILAVSNGLTLNGSILGGLGDAIRAVGTQTWNGGTIELRKNLASTSGSSTLTISTRTNEANPTLTIGSGMTIKGGRALITGTANARLINNGRIVADTTGAEMTVMTHTNNGTLEAINGGALSLAGVDNHGLIKLSNGGVINLAGNASFPVRFFPGTQWIRGAGTVNLVGVIDNATRTLTLDSTSGVIAGRGGRIIGGTVNIQPGGGFNLSNLTIGGGSSPLGLGLDGVTLNGDLYQPESGGQIRLADSTINGTVTLRGANGLMLSKPLNDPTPVTLTGGTIVLDSQGSTRVKVLQPAGGHATLSPSTLVRGGGTSPGSSSTAQLGADFGAGSLTTLVNQGRVSADLPGKVITIRPNTFRNEGTIEAINGGILEVGHSTALQWSSPGGTIRAGTGSQVWLNGAFNTTGLGTLTTLGTGEIRVLGTLTNTGNTLTLARSTGSLFLYNTGKIVGGTVVAPAVAPLRVVDTTLATLDGVSLVGDVIVGDASRINVLNAFSLTGNILLTGSSASASFSGPRTLDAGTIAFSGTNGSERSILPNASLTLGPAVVVRGGFGRIFTSTTAAVINNGLISADVSSQVLRIYQQQFTNNGTIQAINGGQIVFVPPGGVEDFAMLTNASSLAVGILSALTFEGDYRQSTLGSLRVDIGDTGESIESGWLSANAVFVGGTLHVNTLSGTDLVEGHSFHILRAASISGQFDNLYLPSVSAPLRWDTSQLYVDGTITVVPSPGIAALLGLLVGGPLLRRRRP